MYLTTDQARRATSAWTRQEHGTQMNADKHGFIAALTVPAEDPKRRVAGQMDLAIHPHTLQRARQLPLRGKGDPVSNSSRIAAAHDRAPRERPGGL